MKKRLEQLRHERKVASRFINNKSKQRQKRVWQDCRAKKPGPRKSLDRAAKHKLPLHVAEHNVPDEWNVVGRDEIQKLCASKGFEIGGSKLPDAGEGIFSKVHFEMLQDEDYDEKSYLFSVYGTFKRTLTVQDRRQGRYVFVSLHLFRCILCAGLD